MTAEVEFHTGVADKLGFACRLLRKAYRRGARVVVTGPGPLLATLDRDLWTFEERDFVPHVRLPGASAVVAGRTPIWLVEGEPPTGSPEVLVHLGGDPPRDLSPFLRVIEILSTGPDDEQAGRQRWRDYKAGGLKVTHHAAAPKS